MRVVCSVAITMLLGGTVSAAEKTLPYKVKGTLDVRYQDDKHERHVLDILQPEGRRNCPVLFIVHGGSWMFGDKNLLGFYRNVGKQFTEHGMVTVLINYSLAPQDMFPANVKDVARAYAWTRAHIKDYGGDPDHIVLCGHSAGGHLVSLTVGDADYLNDKELKLTDKDRAAIRGVVSVSGVYRIPDGKELAKLVEKMNEPAPARGKNDNTPEVMNLRRFAFNPFKQAFGSEPEICKKASPLTHVRTGLPPHLLFYAASDLPLLPQMALDYHKALKDARVPVTLVKMPDRNHNNIFFNARNTEDPVAKQIREFVDQTKPEK